jgi:hypothetical protein
MGVLMLAIVVWQNSLVFHSLDKLTSILIHAMPGLTLHLYRYILTIPRPPQAHSGLMRVLDLTLAFIWVFPGLSKYIRIALLSVFNICLFQYHKVVHPPWLGHKIRM